MSARLVPKFLRDMATDFVALVSGIASAILGAIGASRKMPLPSWTFWVAAGICLVIAAYRTWLKQYRVAEDLRNTLANWTGSISVTCSPSQVDILGPANAYREIELYLKIPITIHNRRDASTTLTLAELRFATEPQPTLQWLEIGQRSRLPKAMPLSPRKSQDVNPGQTLQLMVDAVVLAPNRREWGDSSLSGFLVFDDTFAGQLAPVAFVATAQAFSYPTIKSI